MTMRFFFLELQSKSNKIKSSRNIFKHILGLLFTVGDIKIKGAFVILIMWLFSRWTHYCLSSGPWRVTARMQRMCRKSLTLGLIMGKTVQKNNLKCLPAPPVTANPEMENRKPFFFFLSLCFSGDLGSDSFAPGANGCIPSRAELKHHSKPDPTNVRAQQKTQIPF